MQKHLNNAILEQENKKGDTMKRISRIMERVSDFIRSIMKDESYTYLGDNLPYIFMDRSQRA